MTTLIATEFLKAFVFHMMHLTDNPVSFKFPLEKEGSLRISWYIRLLALDIFITFLKSSLEFGT